MNFIGWVHYLRDCCRIRTMDRIYLTPSEVRALHADNLEKLTFIHLNPQSTRNKEDNILALIAEFGFEPVFMMTET